MNTKVTGAGVLCFVNNTDGRISDLPKDIVYLVLATFNNKFDFPKGTKDYKESDYSCAFRETYEECNLSISNFKDKDYGSINLNGNLVMYIREIKDSAYLNKEIIKIKPTKGIEEHKYFTFKNYDNCKGKMLKFLEIYLDKAHTMLNNLPGNDII